MFAPKRNENPLHYWISFWPVAPYFGVPWRFEKLAPAPSFFRPGTVAARMTKASADEAAAVVEEAATVGAEAAEAASAAASAVVEAYVGPSVAAPAPATVADDEGEDDGAEIAPQAAETTTVAPSTLYASAPDAVDDLKLIKGVGPKMETMLNDMGIYTFAQIADFTPENLAWVDDNLTSFKGRPLRDDWVAQAKCLMG